MSTTIVPATSDGALSRVPALVEQFDIAAPNMIRSRARQTMLSAGSVVPKGERLWTMCQALRKDKVNQKVVLVLTDRRLLVVEEKSGVVRDDVPLGRGRTLEFREEVWHGSILRMNTPGGERRFKQLLPFEEGTRIAVAFGLRSPYDTALLTAGQPADPGCPPIAYGPQMTLYRDRLLHAGRHLPFDGPVEASVDTAGSIAVTRGRNLAAKGAGTVLLGPIGLFTAGNARERAHDTRELFVLVEGPAWAVSVQVDPNAAAWVRDFAAKVNVAARQHAAATAPAATEAAVVDVAGQLAKLAELYAAGAITVEEFTAAKAQLLGI